MRRTNEMPEFDFRCNGGGCVIVERIAGAVVIRDSKNPYQAGLVFSQKEYADFRRRVRNERNERGARLRALVAQSIQSAQVADVAAQLARFAVRFALARTGSA